ncbi:MAG: thiamine pyrophosphate-dependent dehydrogenase E1 component subunit alpha [Patescibacteria group bacterium]|nr:thiamine pyrophosphate-dependent dehydrogenase E1 component subunit alpha [Patescibacteria group bacterium]MDD5164189.1 thiamine pyrophosphate-dependent dehydrogenase E1 component subunit alpha [Patescibacteria group bacterium]MDD5534477.1 thiamine pyrophosphate-dependent dehydrogenase E1 component subunit alpha [Patescibacteria group bacterium]
MTKSKYSKSFLLKLYQQMLEIRLFEESLIEPILSGEIKTPCHLYTGEEAVAVGVCAALNKKDYAFGNHRSHGHYLAKGGDLKALMSEIFGKSTGCSRGRGGSMHIIDKKAGFLGATPIIAGTVPLAVGTALALKIKKKNRLTVTFFGDGATAEGVISEAFNFSALHKLPILFICENNLYATHMPITESLANPKIYLQPKTYGIKSVRADGNDVIKVFETAKKMITQIKKHKGPAFIEFLTYRMRGHVGPDDNIQGTHTDIRKSREIEVWKKRDPIKKMEKFLIKNKFLDQSKIKKNYQKINKKIEQAKTFSRHSPYPKKNELLKYVFKK